MDRTPAIVLVSGGMDSCVTAAIAAREHATLAFLHANYGQRTEQRELRAFQAIARHYDVRQTLVVSLAHLAAIGGSSLTDPHIPVSPADLHAHNVPTSYVPFRNANMLAVAVSWAEVLGAGAVYVGAVEEDSSGYPDCREAFFDAFNEVIRRGTRPDTAIVIRTPLIHLTKAEIVRQGVSLQAPLEHTWSCYQAEDLACGVCDSCALRLRGFQQAGVQDPIPYAIRPDYCH
ncbi:MAG: 7-cyano-7-deazaguanine synthase QueC [Bacteroidetes bacterium]|nr:7-cyano-7-deazaguanine synthase QueC [Bacteroidota bacterium]